MWPFFKNSNFCHVMIGLLCTMCGIIDGAYPDLKNLIINETDRRPPLKPTVPDDISPTAVRQCGKYAHFDALCGAWPSLCKQESCFEFLDRISKPDELECIGWTCDPGCICDTDFEAQLEVAWAVYKATYNKQEKGWFRFNLAAVLRENAKPGGKRFGLGEDADIVSLITPPGFGDETGASVPKYPGGVWNPFNWFG